MRPCLPLSFCTNCTRSVRLAVVLPCRHTSGPNMCSGFHTRLICSRHVSREPTTPARRQPLGKSREPPFPSSGHTEYCPFSFTTTSCVAFAGSLVDSDLRSRAAGSRTASRGACAPLLPASLPLLGVVEGFCKVVGLHSLVDAARRLARRLERYKCRAAAAATHPAATATTSTRPDGTGRSMATSNAYPQTHSEFMPSATERSRTGHHSVLCVRPSSDHLICTCHLGRVAAANAGTEAAVLVGALGLPWHDAHAVGAAQ